MGSLVIIGSVYVIGPIYSAHQKSGEREKETVHFNGV